MTNLPLPTLGKSRRAAQRGRRLVCFLVIACAPSCVVIQAAFASGNELPRERMARWLDRTRFLESSGNRLAIGDGGRSRGPYQIQRATWTHLGGRAPWSTWAHNEQESRRVAARYLDAAVRECRRRGWAVTFANVRWLYTHGLNTRSRPR